MSYSALESSSRRAIHAIETPEHVTMRFELADYATRASAFAIDVGLQIVAMVVVFFLAIGVSAGVDIGHAIALLMLAYFLLRIFYFTASELYGHGRTIGKRIAKIRVVSRDGGILTAQRIFARNLTREIETFLPAVAVFFGEHLETTAIVSATYAVWMIIFLLFPLMNRSNARLGDLIAGTVVIREPSVALLPDLLDEAREVTAGREFQFSETQLSIYGKRELQVLEEVLRRPHSPEREATLGQIAERIQRKIDWQSPDERILDSENFLQSFYIQQRENLETGLLRGERREEKVR